MQMGDLVEWDDQFADERAVTIQPIERLAIRLDHLLIAAEGLAAGPYTGLDPAMVSELCQKFPAKIETSHGEVRVRIDGYDGVEAFDTHDHRNRPLTGYRLLPMAPSTPFAPFSSGEELNAYLNTKVASARGWSGGAAELPTLGSLIADSTDIRGESSGATIQECVRGEAPFELMLAMERETEGSSLVESRTTPLLPWERLAIRLDHLLIAAEGLTHGPYTALEPAMVGELVDKFPAQIRVADGIITVAIEGYRRQDRFSICDEEELSFLLGHSLLPGGKAELDPATIPSTPAPDIYEVRNCPGHYGAVLRSTHEEEAREAVGPAGEGWSDMALRGREIVIEAAVRDRSQDRHDRRVAAARMAYDVVARDHMEQCGVYDHAGNQALVRVLAMIDLQGHGGEGDLGGDSSKFSVPHLPWVTTGSGSWEAWRKALAEIAWGHKDYIGSMQSIRISACPRGVTSLHIRLAKEAPDTPGEYTRVCIGAPIRGMGRLLAAGRAECLRDHSPLTSAHPRLLLAEGEGGFAAAAIAAVEWTYGSKKTTPEGWLSGLAAAGEDGFLERVLAGEWKESVRWEHIAYLLHRNGRVTDV